MLEGKQLILATKPFIKENRLKSWFYTLSTFAFLIAAFTGSYIAPNIWLKMLCSLLSGLLIVRSFIIYHDFLHHAILNKSKIATYLMTVYGIFVLAPVSIWKRSHDYHHQNNSKLFTSSIGSFPVVTKTKFYTMTKAEQREYLFIRHPLTILFGYLSMFVFGMCVRSFISSPRRHFDSLIALVVHVIIGILLFIFGGWQAWFLTQFFPFFFSLAIGAYYFYAQHNFPGVEFSEKCDWHYENAALASSSFMKMSPIMQWFSGNIGFHHVHHLNARIPFYRLEEAMNSIPELQNAKVTTLKFKDIAACLRLKVWDQELKQMTGL